MTMISCTSNSEEDVSIRTAPKNTQETTSIPYLLPHQPCDELLLYKVDDLLIEADSLLDLCVIRPGFNAKTPNSVANLDTILSDSNKTLFGYDRHVRGLYRWFNKEPLRNTYSCALYAGNLASPIIGTDRMGRMYRTRIREGCAMNGVNFAGHYTLVTWGCGTECEMGAMVDRTNGKVIFDPILSSEEELLNGWKTDADSRLILANSSLLEEHEHYARVSWGAPKWFQWNEADKRIEEVPISDLLERSE